MILTRLAYGNRRFEAQIFWYSIMDVNQDMPELEVPIPKTFACDIQGRTLYVLESEYEGYLHKVYSLRGLMREYQCFKNCDEYEVLASFVEPDRPALKFMAGWLELATIFYRLYEPNQIPSDIEGIRMLFQAQVSLHVSANN